MKIFALLICSLLSSLAHADMPEQDTVPGKDHPTLSRFVGAKMVGYEVKQFDEVNLQAGKIVKRKPEKTLTLTGKYTRIAYNFPRDRSGLEVMRNYQAALGKAGMKTLFSCAKDTCGEGFGDWISDEQRKGDFIKGGGEAYEPFIYGRDDERYVLAMGTTSNGTQIHLAVYVAAPVNDRNGGIYLQIVEGKAMEQGKVSASLSATDMANGIATEGKVAVYGLYFDTDKSDIKPESKAALAEMAKLMQQNPQLRVYIVGHTDSQGGIAHNLELSQKRADAVVRVLSSEYKIDAKRLSAKGVASYVPIGSNDNEIGREKNRRVELVKQ